MTATDPDRAAAEAATEFARHLAPLWEAALGTELLGVYLLGSLAHGGFSRRYSDVDMAVVAEQGFDSGLLDQIRCTAVNLSAEWGPKLSVFWTDRQFSVGRFPPLDRVDYLDRPVVLLERDSVRPERPTLEQIRAYLAGTPFANWVHRARQFAGAATLDPKDRKAYLRTLLYPARFGYSYLSGRMGSNDDAVAFLRQQPIAGVDLYSIEQALACRRAGDDPDYLFDVRGMLPGQVEACAGLIADRTG